MAKRDETELRTAPDPALMVREEDGVAPGAVGLPTEAELEILRVLWGTGPATVREVHAAMPGRGTGYTTVLKQMQVMTEKGLLTRSERFRSHVYQPTAAKARTQQRLTSDLLRRAFDGSAAQLVLGALSAKAVSGEELKEIRAMLDRFESEAGEGLGRGPAADLLEGEATTGSHAPAHETPERGGSEPMDEPAAKKGKRR